MTEPNNYDVILIGAGSIGTPAAYYLARSGLKTLVLEQNASVGQGSNKRAIGGIRATHSDPAKIRLCRKSLEVFSTWQEIHGEDIEWFQGGYYYTAYREEEKHTLQDIVKIQKSYGLNVHWLNRSESLELLPDLNPDGLLGGSYSPEDGSASPLLAVHAFYVQALQAGALFHFGEQVIGLEKDHGKICGITTSRGHYATRIVINCAGYKARAVSQMVGLDTPVTPDSHEAAITEPVERFIDPMIVDVRQAEGSANYYFYQHRNGQLIFCITPQPNIWGEDTRETSVFLPMVARRMVDIMPRLINIRVRRTWRGLYPMTPDGFPIVGWSQEVQGYLSAVGMCGQGFMLGPGIGQLLCRMVNDSQNDEDRDTLNRLSPYRIFSGEEKLK